MIDSIDALEAAFSSMLGEINTSMPGVILSYDASTNRAVVRPTMPRRIADGQPLEAPVIHNVPVMWPTGGGALLTFPIREGDQVWLEFSQYSLDGWLGGNDAAPDDPRRFDLSDCVARPGGGRDVVGVDMTGVVVENGATKLRLADDGNAYLTGTLHVTQDVIAGAISLRNHRHLGVTAGGDLTQGPVP